MRPLSIAITADPYLPVPPRLYGGIERLLDYLVRGLVERGHTVALLAHPDSTPPGRGELLPYGAPPHFGPLPRARELAQVARALWRIRRRIDVIHSNGRLAALLPLLPLRRLPKIQTYQRERVPWRSVRTAIRLGGPSVHFAACSESVYRGGEGPWRRVFNCVEVDRYRFRADVAADAPLAFLGRIEPIKGTHHAIAIARAAGRRLLIAGNRVDTGEGAGYFEREVQPHLDGDRVRYLGPVDDRGKDELLGAAAALLMPVEWEEPFGMVMIEAFACGTPVVAFARGGIPEIVRDGVTGWLCRTVDEAAAAVGRLDRLDRRAARADCEARFGADRYVAAYERLYYDMVARCAS
jgi:glycosyltransferase involved in cell wall biosynthesis